jgi:hypothetical protein
MAYMLSFSQLSIMLIPCLLVLALELGGIERRPTVHTYASSRSLAACDWRKEGKVQV